MDIFIANVPLHTNQAELRLFLIDILDHFDILAFDLVKHIGKNCAFLTAADAKNALRFLNVHGGNTPPKPLYFRNSHLRCRRNNRRELDVHKISALKEAETDLRVKRSKRGSTKPAQSRTIFPFIQFQTGIWEHDNLGRLVFDSKFTDKRKGTITFGKSTLVVYLEAGNQDEYNRHFRIDIPYGILEHTIPSVEHAGRGAIILTLKSPPKIYEILNTNDVHLYSGVEPMAQGLTMPDLRSLSLGRTPKRLHRECSIVRSFGKNPGLCMVYRFTLAELSAAQQAWAHIRRFAAIPQQYDYWRSTIPSRITVDIDIAYRAVEAQLSLWDLKNVPSSTFAARFQLLALVLEGTLTPALVLQLIPHVKGLCVRFGADYTARAVRKFRYQIPTPSPTIQASEFRLSSLVTMLEENIQDIQDLAATADDLDSKRTQHDHLVSVYKAIVTPTGLLLRGPDQSVSNRVLRKYSDKSEFFLRVSFADEDGLPVLHDARCDQHKVYERFREVLRQGINIAGRKHSFLGWSHSSLHFHTAWFMAPFIYDAGLVFAEHVIKDLGDFTHIRCSAKCAARIGQAFSDTTFAVHIPDDVNVTEDEPDIERNGRCFSDGCGTISLELLKKVWRRLPPARRKLQPTTLQIRYRGAKGIVSLDTTLPGQQLRIRKSMTKYKATQSWRDLEICGASYKPLVLYLNHQFIKILEDLGVPRQNFLAVQKDAFATLELIIRNPINAASFLEYCNSGCAAGIPILFMLMHEIGLNFQADRFLTDIVEVAALSSLRDMKYRGRIPLKKGQLLYGVMDETNELQEGEVYITTQTQNEDGTLAHKVTTGDRVVVTRAPALHPGDIQVVKAVNVSQNSPLRDLHNCVVFSQQGARDLPSQLGGGDLDGDLFHIIYDERLIPPMTEPASNYPPTPAQDLGRPVQVDDIADFFIEYMNSDRLGQISNMHKIRADMAELGTKDPGCIVLAQLASDAVDFSKSGKPVNMSQVPKGANRSRPDFMANAPGLVIDDVGSAQLEEEDVDDIDNPDSVSVLDPEKLGFRYYKSQKVLGELYRQIDESTFSKRMKRDFEHYRAAWGGESLIMKLKRYLERETCGFQWDHHRPFAQQLRRFYEQNMLEIMDSMRWQRGTPLTELEVFTGNILGKKQRAATKVIREVSMEIQERFNRDVASIIRRIVFGDGLEQDEHEVLPRAIACFMVSLETSHWNQGAALKSWKYVAASVCLEQLRKYMNYRLRPL